MRYQILSNCYSYTSLYACLEKLNNEQFEENKYFTLLSLKLPLYIIRSWCLASVFPICIGKSINQEDCQVAALAIFFLCLYTWATEALHILYLESVLNRFKIEDYRCILYMLVLLVIIGLLRQMRHLVLNK